MIKKCLRGVWRCDIYPWFVSLLEQFLTVPPTSSAQRLLLLVWHYCLTYVFPVQYVLVTCSPACPSPAVWPRIHNVIIIISPPHPSAGGIVRARIIWCMNLLQGSLFLCKWFLRSLDTRSWNWVGDWLSYSTAFKIILLLMSDWCAWEIRRSYWSDVSRCTILSICQLTCFHRITMRTITDNQFVDVTSIHKMACTGE